MWDFLWGLVRGGDGGGGGGSAGERGVLSLGEQTRYAWPKAGEALKYYSKNEWVQAAVSRVVNAVVKTRLRLYCKSKGGFEEVRRHKVLDLVQAPTRGVSGRRFLAGLVQNLLLTGEAHYRLFYGRGREPVEILGVPTEQMVLGVDGLGRVMRVGYRVQGEVSNFEIRDWVSFMTPDPSNLGRGVSPLKSAALAVDTDIEAQNFQWNYFRNGAVLSGVFKTEQNLSEEDIRRLERVWQGKFGGAKSAGGTAFLGKGASYQSIADSTGVVNVDMRDALMKRILAAFGVSKSMLGVVDGVNYANAQTMGYVFASYVVEPLLELIADGLNAQVLSKFVGSGDYFFRFDSPLPENKGERNEYLRVSKDFLTINEIREREGFAPLVGGDVLFNKY